MQNKLFVFLLLLYNFTGYSQGEFNNWYFGWHAGMTFNTGPPISLPTSPIAQSTLVSGFSISDSAGNFLFCSEGKKIYDKFLNVTPNGAGLLGGGSDCQSAIALQLPGNSRIYYIVTAGHDPGPFGPVIGLYYSVFNMDLNGGLGDIVPGMKNIALPYGDSVVDQLTATRHANNRDYWIVVLNHAKTNNYLAYRLTASGIDPTPVISPTNFKTKMGFRSNCGYLKISFDGRHLVCSDSMHEVCTFNTTTGIVTPRFTFSVNYPGLTHILRSTEFSINSRFLYISGGANLPFNTPLFQYDMNAPDSLSFMQSQYLLGYGAGGNIQSGPDGKIYIGNYTPFGDSVHVIKFPSLPGSSCSYEKNFVSLENTHNFCFPQFVQRYKAYIHKIGTCQNASIKFTTDIWPPADSIRWNFGDPASGAANLSVIANPSHVYSATGTYTVELYVRHNDNRTDTTWKTITIQEAPTPALGPDQNICTGQTATFDAGACTGCTYEWKDLTSGLVIGANQTYTTGTPGVYGVIVTGPNGCSGRDTVQLSIAPTAVMSVTVTGPPGTICSGAAVLFTATAVNGGTSPAYQWKVNGINVPGATNATCSYTPANGDQIACEVTSSDPCVGNSPATSPPVSITVYPLPTVAAVADPSTSICSGNSVTLTGSGAAGYVWSNGIANGIPFVPASTATYTVTGSDAFGCSNTAQIVVTVNQLPNVIANASSSSVCAGSPVILTGSGAVTYVWNNGVMNGIPFIPLASQTYTVTGTDENGCSNTAQITVVVVPAVAVGLSINASANPLCTGSSVTFTATPVNGGTSPAYQWKVNGVNASGATNSGYSYLPVNGDVVTCSLNASASCVTGNPAISNAITMIVNNNLPAGVSIVASANPFCPGSSVTFTATPVNGGSSPAFQWKVNGINAAGGNASAYTYSPANSDVVTCVMNSNLTCVTANPATSPSITLTVRDAPNVIFSRCFDTITTVSAKPFRLKGGLPLGGTYSGPGVNSTTGIFTPSVAGPGTHTITYIYTNTYGCSSISHSLIHSFTQSLIPCGSALTDIRDGKVYPTVQIGSQCWMQKNLDYGTAIPSTNPQTENCIPEKYNCPLSIVNCQLSLYQWDELMRYETAPSAQGLCPPGWHIPASAEWSALINWLGGAATAGSAMKDPFAAGGFHSEQTGFLYLNYRWAFFDDSYAGAMYWTSTPSGSDRAMARGLNEINHSVSLYPAARANAFGVRCVKDAN